MVIKTVNCSFSEYRIYPGHGSTLIRRDGQPVVFLNHKIMRLHEQKKKVGKLHWSLAWRRSVKKIAAVSASKRTRHHRAIIQRPIFGMSLAAIAEKKSESPEVRKAAQDAALREVKNRKKEAKATRVASKPVQVSKVAAKHASKPMYKPGKK